MSYIGFSCILLFLSFKHTSQIHFLQHNFLLWSIIHSNESLTVPKDFVTNLFLIKYLFSNSRQHCTHEIYKLAGQKGRSQPGSPGSPHTGLSPRKSCKENSQSVSSCTSMAWRIVYTCCFGNLHLDLWLTRFPQLLTCYLNMEGSELSTVTWGR